MTEPEVAPAANRIVVHAAFFLSGAASLILQIVWFKQLQFLLGSSTFAVSVTVAGFFLGLSVGAAIGGRLADRVARPLVLYGALEGSLAVVSALLTATLSRWEVAVAALSSLLAPDAPAAPYVTVALAMATLFPPTVLMGATLPVLTRHLVRSRSSLAERLGGLYALNTLGAATGTLVVGLVLVAALGVRGASAVASGIYLVIAAVVLALSRSSAPVPVADVEELPAAGSRPSEPPARSSSALLLAFGMAGFASIASEVVWFRCLSNNGLATVTAFSGMLTVYLLGLVLGSFVSARWLSADKAGMTSTFARLQLLIAAVVVASIAPLGRFTRLVAALAPLAAAVPGTSGPAAAVREVLGFWLCCGLVLIVPTTSIGTAFPLAGEIATARASEIGRRVGGLYAVNTFGGVLGSLVTGFVLLPRLGSEATLALVAATFLGVAAVVVAAEPSLRRERALAREAALAVAVVVVALGWMGPSYLRDGLTSFVGGEVKAFAEAPSATYAVLDYAPPGREPFQQLVVNGNSYANNGPPGRRYMAMLAHLPTLLHARPTSALVVCIGTGTTVGALTTHAELDAIDAVDLSKEVVLEYPPLFVPINHSFFRDPRVRRVVADGRHFLLGTSDAFDVVTFEPPPPMDAGIVNLYTTEFYALARQRLRPGGVLAQWAPMDMARADAVKMIVRTMQRSFAHVSLWVPDRMEGIAIGSDEPLRIDYATLAERMRAPGVAEDLHAVGVDSPEDLLATFVGADDELAPLVGDVPALTDDHPRIEYSTFLPPGQLDWDTVRPTVRPVERWMTSPPPDPGALERARAVMDDIWFEHQAWTRGDVEARRRLVDDGLSREPGNTYLQYLRAQADEDAAGPR